MAVIETWFNQDLQKPVQVNYLDGNLFSNNGNGNKIGVVVTNNGEAVTLTGTVSGYAVLADGTTVPCTGTRSGNKASILIPPAAYLPGAIFVSVFLTDGNTVTTLAAVSSSVLRARTDNQVDPGSVVTDWTQTINAAMQDVVDAAEGLEDIVATPYEELTFPVPLGAYTIYNHNLYRCTTPIATSESFTAAHWSAKTNLGQELSDLNRAVINNRDLLTKGNADLMPVWEQGYLANSTGQEVQSQEGIRSGWLYISDAEKITVNLLSRDLISEAKIFFYENIGENRSKVIVISGLTSTVYIDPSWKYARIHFAKWNSTISVSDAVSIFENATIGYTAFKDNLIDTLARDTDTIINNRDLLIKGNAELVPIWEQGYLADSTGQEVQSQEGIRSKWLYIGDADAITVNLLSRDLISEAKIFFYEDIGVDRSSVKVISNLTATVAIDPTWKYARIHFAKWNSTINVPDATSIFGNAAISYTAQNDEAFGYSNSRIFSNESIWHKEIYPLYYDEASTYTAQVIETISIEKDTIYSLYVGRIVGPSSAVLRVYIKYADDSVERYDVSENNRARTFKTANKDISIASIIAVAVNGTAPGESGKALFIDGVLLIGELKVSQIYVDNQYFAIPAYYMNHLLAKEKTIRANEKTCSFNGDSFVFLTDTHYSYNYMVNRNYGSNSVNTNHSIQMVKHIMDNTATRMIVFGGDLLDLCEGIDEMVHSANSFFDLVGKYSYRLMCAVGNHEYYTDLHDQSLGRPTPNELYGALIKFNEGYIVSKGPMDSYCFDNTVQKIRYVVVSCGRNTENTVEQTKWVLNCFLETPAGYKIITVGHAFMLDNMTGFRGYYHKQIVEGLDAVKAGTSYTFEGTTYDYSTLSNVSVICIITGHTHIDGYLVSEGGVLCICTTCDCWSRAGEIVDGEVVVSPRPTGGIEEQAFDVMQFDFDNELIHCTRIGAGSDRTFTYGTNPGPVTT